MIEFEFEFQYAEAKLPILRQVGGGIPAGRCVVLCGGSGCGKSTLLRCINGLILDDGEECVCVQSISYSLLCRWFQAAVLPLDAALYAEIIKDRDEVKRCCECGATFQPKSNRAKYCAACAKRMRRRKEAERQRKRYWQHEA